jgi:ABC-type antimicrobial peptide transport system permease subunit
VCPALVVRRPGGIWAPQLSISTTLILFAVFFVAAVLANDAYKARHNGTMNPNIAG